MAPVGALKFGFFVNNFLTYFKNIYPCAKVKIGFNSNLFFSFLFGISIFLVFPSFLIFSNFFQFFAIFSNSVFFDIKILTDWSTLLLISTVHQGIVSFSFCRMTAIPTLLQASTDLFRHLFTLTFTASIFLVFYYQIHFICVFRLTSSIMPLSSFVYCLSTLSASIESLGRHRSRHTH